MNLEDFAYLDDDRWYIDPNVSLGEQNAFIDNLRSTQAQDNAQIEQQTRALGTQVPSQLGGLVGGGSYFRSRYQTPQTNKTIADLRTAAQSQAMSQVLNNIIAKKQKEYKDAYRAAQERGSNKSNNNNNNTGYLYDDIDGRLKINTNPTTTQDGIDPNEQKVKRGDVTVDDWGTMYFEDWAGRKWKVVRPSGGEAIGIDSQKKGGALGTPEIGDKVTVGGKEYIYTNNGWFRIDGEYDEGMSKLNADVKKEQKQGPVSKRQEISKEMYENYQKTAKAGESERDWLRRMFEEGKYTLADALAWFFMG